MIFYMLNIQQILNSPILIHLLLHTIEMNAVCIQFTQSVYQYCSTFIREVLCNIVILDKCSKVL